MSVSCKCPYQYITIYSIFLQAVTRMWGQMSPTIDNLCLILLFGITVVIMLHFSYCWPFCIDGHINTVRFLFYASFSVWCILLEYKHVGNIFSLVSAVIFHVNLVLPVLSWYCFLHLLQKRSTIHGTFIWAGCPSCPSLPSNSVKA